MQSIQTGFVTRAEWWWVTMVSLALLTLAFAPFLILTLTYSPDSGQAFLGIIHQFDDAAAYLSKMQQGAQGQYLLFLQHTPDNHQSALIHPLYALLGQTTRVVSLSPVIVFHIARLIMAYIMYVAIYQLAASIWVRVRTRRLFFVVAAFGSGFGWLTTLLTGSATTPDVSIAQAYPFFSTIVNIHYPMTITALALLASVIIPVLRPGITEVPSVDNGGIIAVLMSLLLSFVYPEAIIPLATALILCTLIQAYTKRRYPRHELRWALWVIVPSLPFAAYYLALFQGNDIMALWLQQRLDVPPSPFSLLIGLGLPLFIALPSLLRALRRLEPDGDRFMVFWLLSMLVWLYLPVPMLQYAIVGLMLPIAYFAARSLEEYWFQFVRRQQRRRLYVIAVPILALSQLFVLFIPTSAIARGWSPNGALLRTEYVAALDWLADQTTFTDVVLASPTVATWLPYATGARVVYGHPDETINPQVRRQQVLDWYAGEDDAACEALSGLNLVREEAFPVTYVIYGSRERALGNPLCLNEMTFLASFGDVEIYATPSLFSLR